MQPRMNPSLSPPFHELDEYTFQRLCCDVFARQRSVVSCDVYGTRGQKQRGIDLLAHRRDGSGIEVGQCKCYREFSHTEIRKASNEFFKHLAYWQQRNVRYFILFVACDLDRTQQQDEICTQTERFAQHGIEYEAWSANTLRLQLGPHRDIAQRHLPSYWVENICGSVRYPSSELIGTPSSSALTMELPSSQVERLYSGFSRAVAAQLEEIRERSREGKRREAYERVRAIQQDESWSILERPLQARILRMLATYVLSLENNVSAARELVNTAHQLDPQSDDTILRTVLAHHTEGAEAALQEIGRPITLDTVNLEIALLLLGLGRADDALTKLTCLPREIEPNAETRRLHALALLATGDILGAQTQIQQALAECPTWEDVRIDGAIINYFSTLAPAAIPHHLVAWPTPVDWPFVKRDTQSLDRLRKAKSEFEELALYTEDEETRESFEVWCLACLANDPDRQAEAQEFCQHLLEKDPTNHRVVIWALARNYTVNLQTSEQALEQVIGDTGDERT
jgi:hypothetical protein